VRPYMLVVLPGFERASARNSAGWRGVGSRWRGTQAVRGAVWRGRRRGGAHGGGGRGGRTAVLIHPLVVHFPIALWLASTLFDALGQWRADPMFRRTAYWLVGLGLIGAAASIALGWTDLFAQEAQGVGTAVLLKHRYHSWAAYVATAVYLANFVWRWRTDNRAAERILPLSLLGAVLISITGYLGGDLRNVM